MPKLLWDRSDENRRNSWLLLIAFVVLVSLLGALIGMVWFDSAIMGMIILVPVAVIISLITFWQAEAIPILVSGAKPADPIKDQYLIRKVEGLAIAAGLSTPPKVYIIEDTAMNAFAAGRDPTHSVIVVTSGLYERLKPLELEGVIAHEMSHIKNYDIRFMTYVVILVGITALVSDIFVRSMFYGHRDNNKGGSALIIVAIIFAILTPVIAVMLQLAVSRKREFLADADGALLTRYPEGLASALEKLSYDKEPLEAANSATAHLYISDPLKTNPSFLSGWFNTHPPVAERIAALRNMDVKDVERQLEQKKQSK